jgi:RNA polymerase sigma-70 factor (ECF subfamily)
MRQVDESVISQQTPEARPEDSPDTFEEFFLSEHARLFGAMYVLTRNTHEAEELMQQAFVKVWERWEYVRGMNDPTGYLYRTAMNEFRSGYRRAVRTARRALRREGSDPLADVESRDEALRALSAVTPRQRMALVLTQILGYDVAEAAAILGIEPGSLRMLVSRGRARLARTMEAENG